MHRLIGLREVVKTRNMSRKGESLSFNLSRFLFKFMTENVSSHKYVEPNKLSIFLENDRIIGNLPLSRLPVKVNRRKLLVFTAPLIITLQLNELHLQL